MDRYELKGVNGSLLPAPINPEQAQDGDQNPRASVVAASFASAPRPSTASS